MWRCLFFLFAVLSAQASAGWDNLELKGYRWPTAQQVVEVELGHHDVKNATTDIEVRNLVSNALFSWTSRMSGPFLSFNVTCNGDVGYEMEYDQHNRIYWGYGDACFLAQSSEYTRSAERYKRMVEFDLCINTRLDSGSNCDPRYPQWLGDYCWYDCSIPHGSECAPDYSYDIASNLLHEAGHIALGLGHYSPCGWSQSCMYASAQNGCVMHRSLGATDLAYARWAMDGVTEWGEPGNDSPVGAVDLGELNQPPYALALESYLPGYVDLDFWKWRVTGLEGQGCRIRVAVVNMDEGMRLRAELSDRNGLQMVQEGAPYQDLALDVMAIDGDWYLNVTSSDGRAGGQAGTDRYEVFVDLWRPTADAPVARTNPTSNLRMHGMQVLGSSEGMLELYDVGGRLRNRWTFETAGWDLNLRNNNLPRGVYFLRFAAPASRPESRKLVVVR